MNRIILILSTLAVIGGYLYLTRTGTNELEPGPMAEVVVPELTKELQAGEALFNENCASCHGKNAAGINGVAPPLVHVIYEPSHHSDAAFVLAARNGVRAHHWRFGNMPPVEGVGESEIKQITSYVRVLQRVNGIQ